MRVLFYTAASFAAIIAEQVSAVRLDSDGQIESFSQAYGDIELE